EPIVGAARAMFAGRIDLAGRGVRLIGVGISGLATASSVPTHLFSDPATDRARKMAEAQDAVRERLGERAVTRAALLKKRVDGPKSGLGGERHFPGANPPFVLELEVLDRDRVRVRVEIRNGLDLAAPGAIPLVPHGELARLIVNLDDQVLSQVLEQHLGTEA